MMNLGKMMADPEAMKRFGNTVVGLGPAHAAAEEDLRRARRAARNPLRVGPEPELLLHRDGAHLEDLADLPGRGRRVAGEGRGRHRRREQNPAAGRHLDLGRRRPVWVNTWNDGKVRLYDIRDPHAPKQIFDQKIGEQVNMVSQSWDGKRVYFTSSLLANWDKTAPAGPRPAVLQAVRLGRQGAEAAVQHRLRRGKARRAAPDALRRVLAVRPEGRRQVRLSANNNAMARLDRRGRARVRCCVAHAAEHVHAPPTVLAPGYFASRVHGARAWFVSTAAVLRVAADGPCSTTRATPGVSTTISATAWCCSASSTRPAAT